MIELQDLAVVSFALSPLAGLLCIWAIGWIADKLMLIGAYVLGSLALLIMGEP